MRGRYHSRMHLISIWIHHLWWYRHSRVIRSGLHWITSVASTATASSASVVTSIIPSLVLHHPRSLHTFSWRHILGSRIIVREQSADELIYYLRFLLLSFQFLLFFRNPLLYQKRPVTKHCWLIECLDRFLSIGHSIIEDVGKLEGRLLRGIVFVDPLLKFNRENLGVFHLEFLTELFLCNMAWNILDVDVGVKGLSEILSDRMNPWTLSRFILLFTDMPIHDKELVFRNLLFVHLLLCLLCVLGILKAHVTIVLQVLVFVSLDANWLNLTKFPKHLFELVIIGTFRQIFDE